MQRAHFKLFTEDTTQARHNLMFGTRGPDYAQDSDALANFKKRAISLNSSPELVCLGDMSKHLQQVADFLSGKVQSKGQAIWERLDDIGNYTDLLRGILAEGVLSEKVGTMVSGQPTSPGSTNRRAGRDRRTSAPLMGGKSPRRR